MWMGGLVPLGYEVCDQRLVINPSEAETVRQIFQRSANSAACDFSRRNSIEMGFNQSFELPRAEPGREVIHSRGALFTRCSATRSTSARSDTRARAIRVNISQ